MSVAIWRFFVDGIIPPGPEIIYWPVLFPQVLVYFKGLVVTFQTNRDPKELREYIL